MFTHGTTVSHFNVMHRNSTYEFHVNFSTLSLIWLFMFAFNINHAPCEKKNTYLCIIFLSCTEDIIRNISSILCLAPLHGSVDAKSLFYETFGNPFFSILLTSLPEYVTRAHKPAAFYNCSATFFTVRR
jgi:hypothetical protein